MRRYVLLLGAVFITEAALYSALAPLLASYARNGEISKIEAGVLNGAYAIGLIPGALAAGSLTSRLGTRPPAIAGAALFAVSTASFGIATSIEAQSVARGVQGLAAGCMWGAALAWLINLAPEGRRGEFVGIAVGSSTLGAVIGPAFGIVAVEVGRQIAYLGAASAIALLIVPLSRIPTRQPVAREEGLLRKLSGSPTLRVGIWLTLAMSACLAILLTLLPLRLEHAGATPSTVGAVFLIGSLLSVILAKPAGRFSDRRGPARATLIGLVMTIVVLAAFALELSLIPLVVISIVATVVLIAGLGVPAERLLFDGAAERGLSPGASAPILILCIAVGESIGSPAGALIATVTSESALFLAVATMMAVGAFGIRNDLFARSPADVSHR